MAAQPVQVLLGFDDFEPQSLTNAEVRVVYLHGERRMRAHHDRLAETGVHLEERARQMVEIRGELRAWTRTLMADTDAAGYLGEIEPNPTLDQLLQRYTASGLDRDEILQRIITSSTKSRPAVNDGLGIDPEDLPRLPPVSRG